MTRAINWSFTAVAVLLLVSQSFAEEKSVTYSGKLWDRSTLSGDWGGTRNDLAVKGVTFDASWTEIWQGVTNGGNNFKEEGWQYGGRGNLTINVDSQKLGLWPGGFLTVEVEGNVGSDINGQPGAIMPVNSNQVYPTPPIVNSDNLNVPEVAIMQFFSYYVGMVVGKLDTTSGDANEFAHGKGDVQFLNLALNINPVTLLVSPYSTLGAGLIILPTKDPDAALVTLSAIQSVGKASTVGDWSDDQVTYAGEARVRTDFFGLTGHQLIGGEYSNKDFTSLDQSLRFIIQNGEIQMKSNSWSAYYNFDQYVYETKKGSGRGIGIFGRYGISDGNPNPINHFFSLGLGGKGVIPGRPYDGFGIGYYYIDVSNPTFTTSLATRSLLRDEYGVEAYYNYALTQWMKLTEDIQFIRPSQKDFFTGLTRENLNNATVFGVRLQAIF
ncbi:MAG TPA: carbohydrate porin [Nitrospirota bacterium]|nr:carbohydrate porin [Nitrospirota bacterium]